MPTESAIYTDSVGTLPRQQRHLCGDRHVVAPLSFSGMGTSARSWS
jgi:hypothetical protein